MQADMHVATGEVFHVMLCNTVVFLPLGAQRGYSPRLWKKVDRPQRFTTTTAQAWLFRRLWSLPLRPVLSLGREAKLSKAFRWVFTQCQRAIKLNLRQRTSVRDKLTDHVFLLQERAGVKMVMIQDGPQNTGADKPLRISGEPFKVQVGHSV